VLPTEAGAPVLGASVSVGFIAEAAQLIYNKSEIVLQFLALNLTLRKGAECLSAIQQPAKHHCQKII
jgi:hypothetical protein